MREEASMTDITMYIGRDLWSGLADECDWLHARRRRDQGAGVCNLRFPPSPRLLIPAYYILILTSSSICADSQRIANLSGIIQFICQSTSAAVPLASDAFIRSMPVNRIDQPSVCSAHSHSVSPHLSLQILKPSAPFKAHSIP
jgi:hypothetical protein